MRQVIEVMRTLAGVLCVALLMCGCATPYPLIVDPSQAHDLGLDEGIVFGSVRVEITPGGERLAGFKYDLIGCVRKHLDGFISFVTSSPCDEKWELAVSAGEERTFVVRLPTGYHRIDGLRAIPTKWYDSGGEFDIFASYQATSGEVTYIGRLVLVLPERLTIWAGGALLRVEDGLATAQAALGGGYGERFESPRVEFIKLYSNEAIFKGNPPPAAQPVP